MTNANDVRRAHDLLDHLGLLMVLSKEQDKLLRSFLPELPKRKTLEDLCREVYDVWVGTNGDEWPDEIHGELETWLDELHEQLKGLKDAPATVPALPAGMRIAEHEDYGRCVVSPSDDESNDTFRIFYRDEGYVTDSFSRYVESSSLTFIDTEPTKPAHPEFLETEADYRDAPEGTIVASAKASPAMKCGRWWESSPHMDRDAKIMAGEPRQILRWGWGK